MGVLDFLGLGKSKNTTTSKESNEKPESFGYAYALDGTTPIFSQFGTNIYNSDAVQQCIERIVQEMKKAKPTHVKCDLSEPQNFFAINSGIQKVFNNPNRLMSTSDFIEKIVWSLELNYNSFVIPTFTEFKVDGKWKRIYKEFYPIAPKQVEFIEDSRNVLYVKFTFARGQTVIYPYKNVVHIRKNYSVNDYMGGDLDGQPNNKALLETLKINHSLLQGVSKGIETSMQITAAVKYNMIMDEEKMKPAIAEFENNLRESKSGIMPMDLKADYIPIKRDVKIVDKDTLQFIDEKILRHFGVSRPILTGDYNKAQYEAFFNQVIEPRLLSISQAFTKTLFSEAARNRGHQIKLYFSEVAFMTMDQKMEIVRILGDSGTLYENQKLAILGFPPNPELNNVRMQSLNYVNTEIASEYQLVQKKKGRESNE